MSIGPHIKFNPETLELILLDQRFLPEKEVYFVCKSVEDIIFAIKEMVVRGAPAIGVTAAYGCVLALNEVKQSECWQEKLARKLADLAACRPTAVNLRWAIEQMTRGIDFDCPELLSVLIKKAQQIHEEDIKICKTIGKIGSKLINDGDVILTHCNAGALATGGYGTALGVICSAAHEGKKIKVIADETRPLFQGARLTAYELANEQIPVSIACDNACALLMQKVHKVITGADRVAANGDTANKIGTFGVAIIAQYYKVPFYIACPVSTIDVKLANGSAITIEERNEEEVTIINNRRIAPHNVNAYNFAFDVTPASLITGIITEKGILYPPFEKSIADAIKVTE